MVYKQCICTKLSKAHFRNNVYKEIAYFHRNIVNLLQNQVIYRNDHEKLIDKYYSFTLFKVELQGRKNKLHLNFDKNKSTLIY